ncbi:GntR family transcriptional regulator [Gluconacetobacter liquefaciens]|uniref:GntR family transcriptional regulator n=1 Tax=Gluconacetobacter liquefaciens TaxID=89584 RepID=A0A370G0H6_GLULI|nr:GntR family transcriptional regulator [Gluconacetobacter liquefaciens]MBB2187179.1 GntR family transcriptional regulator [Gluconacetobacter liquefaciens]RDI36720.1 GntR family transcriptional regulator [Gluconacetobacter liquefaciens]GBQ98573.1 GntR family transcriptional regulator [Gluconacetobacter liquefaciens NRIC 0522]GEB38405.1 GntR family transcriptional regulator [Gluconacetobacter liquefaciens]
MAAKKPTVQTALRDIEPLSQQSLIPLHHRVYVVLYRKLMEGSFQPDEPMPTEAELSEVFGVSRITLRTAMKRLESEGLIRRLRGRGTFPLAAPIRAAMQSTAVRRNQVSLAFKTQVRIVGYETVDASPVMAEQLGVPVDAPLLRIERVRSDTRSAISHSVCLLPAEFARFLPRRQLGTLPVSAALEAAGVELHDFDEHLNACAADATAAEALGVDIGTPLLSMLRIARDAAGRVVERLMVVYRPDRYEYFLSYSAESLRQGEHALHLSVRDLAPPAAGTE